MKSKQTIKHGPKVITSRERVKITSADCLKCGACCCSLANQESYCDVTSEDEKRLGRKFVRLNVVRFSLFDQLVSSIDGNEMPPGAIRTAWVAQRTEPAKGIEVLRCAALRGTVLSKVKCSVYDKRPEVCDKAVKPGDRNCKELRKIMREKLEEASQLNK